MYITMQASVAPELYTVMCPVQGVDAGVQVSHFNVDTSEVRCVSCKLFGLALLHVQVAAFGIADVKVMMHSSLGTIIKILDIHY